MNLFKNAIYLLQNMTLSERALEPHIAALGERYRAQHLLFGIGIVDFALLDRRVIIEVDGASHDKPEQQDKDALRTYKLEKLGWVVVRCKNAQAVSDPGITLLKLLVEASRPPNPEAALEALRGRGLLDVHGLPKRPTRKPAPRQRASPVKRARKAKD